ncbi:hypothetical protein [Litorivivens sp.]|uniref:phage tail assembly protein T n=1 Tax=Litorivivens sp. TaxID=2020868 RepID=UPI003567F745
MVQTGRSREEILSWPHQDIVDLIAYDQEEPFGAWRDNWHMAVMAQMFASVHTKKGHKPPPMKDFFYISQDTKSSNETRTFFSRLSAKAKKHGK